MNGKCHFKTAKDGTLEVTITIPAQAVAMADDYAARLPSTREEVLRSYLESCFETLDQGIEDHCQVAWIFPTAEAVESFIKREKLDLRGTGVIEWSDGSGFGVDTLYKFDELLAKRRKTPKATAA